MNLPKSFILKNKRDLEKHIEYLLKKQTPNPKTISLLLKSCEEFLEEINSGLGNYEEYEGESLYGLGEQLAEEIRYTKHDLEIFNQEISKIGCHYLDD